MREVIRIQLDGADPAASTVKGDRSWSKRFRASVATASPVQERALKADPERSG